MYLISYFDGLALTYRINVIESEPIYPLRPGKHSMELFLEDPVWPSLFPGPYWWSVYWMSRPCRRHHHVWTTITVQTYGEQLPTFLTELIQWQGNTMNLNTYITKEMILGPLPIARYHYSAHVWATLKGLAHVSYLDFILNRTSLSWYTHVHSITKKQPPG